MNLTVRDASLFVNNMSTRIPFEYGITRLTALPHLFVRVRLELDGEVGWGHAADGLPPSWFTKDPDQTYRDEIQDMCTVISTAVERSVDMGTVPDPFTFWWELYSAQMPWGRNHGFPDLLTHFGVSLVERAVLDAFCRILNRPLHEVIQNNLAGIRLGQLHDELEGTEPAEWLAESPRKQLRIRHTVGLSDPLTSDDVSARERPEDGLPLTLEENIKTYGVDHFKIKVPGELAEAKRRLHRLSDLLTRHLDTYSFTLDGNEMFKDVDDFRDFWETLNDDDDLRSFFRDGLLYVEQPLHRKTVHDDHHRDPVDWPDRPPIIIDESDACVESLPDALQRGYSGTSHKNCKGVFKGIVNRCLLAWKNQQQNENSYIMSAEDLATVGPVSLLQDLSVISVLGLRHAERNGHHYFSGLRAMPAEVQRSIFERHGNLYRTHDAGDDKFPSLDIQGGDICLSDVNRAPFGYDIDLDPDRFTPLSDWSFDSLDVEHTSPDSAE